MGHGASSFGREWPKRRAASAAASAESMTLMPAGTALVDQRAQQRVVGAAEDQRVGIHALGGGFGVQFVQIDLRMTSAVTG
jgi:hypothetical protein